MYAEKINMLLDYIEENLAGEISHREMAEMMAMSVYELRRIFAFIIGTPLSDYIRQRRLSSSVFDLRSGELSITEIAAKYGYDSPSSFSRAFREMQGISPTEAKNSGVRLKAYPRASLRFSVTGADSIEFRLIERGRMKLCGMRGVSDPERSDCGEEIWNDYYDKGYHDRLCALGAFEGEGAEFAAYSNLGESCVECHIGALLPVGSETPEGMDELIIEPSLWAVFDSVGTLDWQQSGAYYRVVNEWLGASGYEREPDICNLEAFPVEVREESEDMKWKIYYPLKRKK